MQYSRTSHQSHLACNAVTIANSDDMSGFRLAKKIKKISRKTPVILIKARDCELEPDKAKESGADIILNRPFHMDKTLDLVERVMVTYQSAQA